MNTLLPEARVDVFATDPQTIQVARDLANDWRFARVRVTVKGGDIATAINHFGTEKSGNLIIIETDRIDTSFTQHLEHLANVCEADTAAIFVGPENDITLYRQLLDMGATDYLVRPLKKDDLTDVIGKTLLQRLGTNESRVVSVMGAKGGVGTSRIAQLLAHGMAQANEAVTLLDCGGSWGLASVTYGREPMMTLRDLANAVRSQPDTVEDLLLKITPNLSWVATGGDALLNSTMTSDGFEGIIDVLTRRHPNIVVDLSQSATGIRAMAFAKSHHIVVVTNATPLALRNARLLIKEIHQLRGAEAPLHLVVNACGFLPKEELSPKEIERTLGITPLIVLPFQADIFARLYTSDPEPAIQLMHSLTPTIQPLLRAVIGRTMSYTKSAVAETPPSLLQRLMKRG